MTAYEEGACDVAERIRRAKASRKCILAQHYGRRMKPGSALLSYANSVDSLKTGVRTRRVLRSRCASRLRRHHAIRTDEAYWLWTGRFMLSRQTPSSGDGRGRDEIESYLSRLVPGRDGWSPSLGIRRFSEETAELTKIVIARAAAIARPNVGQ
jgi:hypothetical protein